jgi:hypothetical protein
MRYWPCYARIKLGVSLRCRPSIPGESSSGPLFLGISDLLGGFWTPVFHSFSHPFSEPSTLAEFVAKSSLKYSCAGDFDCGLQVLQIRRKSLGPEVPQLTRYLPCYARIKLGVSLRCRPSIPRGSSLDPMFLCIFDDFGTLAPSLK